MPRGAGTVLPPGFVVLEPDPMVAFEALAAQRYPDFDLEIPDPREDGDK